MKNLRVLAVIAVFIGGFAYLVSFSKPGPAMQIFAGISGPSEKTVVATSKETHWQNYSSGSDSRLAIFLTQPKSNWLGLAHGLKSIGVPFSITNDYAEALRHKVVIAYPLVSPSTVSMDGMRALADFVRNGGTLIGFEVFGSTMQDIFGFKNTVALRARHQLKFTHPAADADPLEKTIPIDSAKTTEPMGVYTYKDPSGLPIAVYEDGGAAIIEHKTGNGQAIAFGLDLGALILKGHNNRQENMARSYDDGYEPTLDVLLRLIEDIYRHGDDRAVTLQPIPNNKKLAVLLTHDIDYTRSLTNAIDYATYEHDAGIRATYFMQTKYIRDYNDDVILGPDSPDYLKKLRDLGMEIGSHTVSHSRQFAHFSMGDGRETYPEYHPFVQTKDVTNGGTILGELRVSRFLIEQLVPGVHVASFRPGYLSNPYALPQALVATDYAFSSSVTANDSLTHLPFQLNYDRSTTSEMPIYEFPITLSDGPPILSDRLPQGIGLAKKIARHGGLFVILIHPDVVEPKLGFEKKFVASTKDFSWFGTIEDFGSWWTARDAVQIDSHWLDGKLIVHITSQLPIDGLTLTPPSGLHPSGEQPIIKAADSHNVVLGKLKGTVDIDFTH